MKRLSQLLLLLLPTLSCTASKEQSVAGTPGNFVYISAGGGHACALDREGRLWCWGIGGNGQLGVGELLQTDDAIPVAGDNRYLDVCTNYVHTCAIDVAGVAWCWGENWEGQLGITSQAQQVVPARVETTERFTRISCGHDHTCALGEAGDVWCWGFAGLSPTGQVIRSQLPVRVDQLAGIAHIAGAKQRLGVLTSEGIALELPREDRCDFGNIDNKNLRKASTGFPWEGLTLSHYCMGNSISCGLTVEGKLFCLGGLSGNCTQCSELPRRITAVTYTDLSCGEDTVCVIDTAGAAKCFGNNRLENLCVGSSQECLEVPRAVVGGHRFQQISTSLEFHCALEPEGSVWCWANPVFDPENLVDPVYNTVPTIVKRHPAYSLTD